MTDGLDLKVSFSLQVPPPLFFSILHNIFQKTSLFFRVSNSLDFACLIPVLSKMCSSVPCIAYKLVTSSRGLIRFRFNYSGKIISYIVYISSIKRHIMSGGLFFVMLVTTEEHYLDPLFHSSCKMGDILSFLLHLNN